MRIQVIRQTLLSDRTLGKMYIDGIYFCDTLEDTDRGLLDAMSFSEIAAIKIYGRTAIPKGTYKVILNFSNKFQKYMPLLLNTKGFGGIRIHNGISPEHTLGCILVGQPGPNNGLVNSKSTFAKLMGILNSVDKKQSIIIEVL